MIKQIFFLIIFLNNIYAQPISFSIPPQNFKPNINETLENYEKFNNAEKSSQKSYIDSENNYVIPFVVKLGGAEFDNSELNFELIMKTSVNKARNGKNVYSLSYSVIENEYKNYGFTINSVSLYDKTRHNKKFTLYVELINKKMDKYYFYVFVSKSPAKYYFITDWVSYNLHLL